MTKILWHSNAPWVPTGYGQQTDIFTSRLRAEGHEIAISSFYGLEGNMIGWKGIPVLPGVGGTYGNESLPGHARAFLGEPHEGLVVTLMDVWVLHQETFKQLNVASWTPVDHDPAPPRVLDYFRNTAAIPIAMSRFGERMLADFDPLYVPHGVETDAYRPILDARKNAGVPDSAFVVGMVAANKGNPARKCFIHALEAFKAFRERHDDAILALHTELQPHDGIDLVEVVARLGLADSVQPSDQYACSLLPFKAEQMARVYSSFDVLLNPSSGEGFGIPIIEAQACGTPVIVTDFSAMAEVCGSGWKVGYTPRITGQFSRQAEPNVEEIVEALEEAYSMPEAKRKRYAAAARRFAEGYDADRVTADYLLPALREIEERIGERPKLEVAA